MRAGELSGAADGVGLGPGAVDRARRQAVEDVGHRTAGAEQQVVVLFQAQEAGEQRRVAGQDLAGVAVDMLLPEAAIVDDALEVEPVADVVARGRVQEVELVLVGLRRGVDAGPAPVEHFDRRRRRRAERIRCAGVAQVKFGILAARADVGVDPAQLRVRAVAPAFVVERVGGEVAGDVAVLFPVLHCRCAASERAAEQLRLGAVVAEAVLHPDRERAAERVEPVDRTVGNDVDAGDGIFRDEVPVHGIAERLRSRARRSGRRPILAACRASAMRRIPGTRRRAGTGSRQCRR